MDAASSKDAQPEWKRYAEARSRVLRSAVNYCSPADGLGMLGPDFICIGAAKTGTSWLYDILRRHPLVWLPPIKEISYFTSHYVVGSREYFRPKRAEQVAAARRYWAEDNATPVWRPRWDKEGTEGMRAAIAHLEKDELTDEWYQGIFRFRNPDQVAGDISPDYALMPRAGVRHVMALNPHVRILVLLRDPIERLISHGAMTLKDELTVEALRTLLHSQRAENWRMVSDYGYWLPRWLAAVDPLRIMVEFNGRIGREPLAVLEKICGFLGIAFDAGLFPKADQKVYEGRKPDRVAELAEELRAEFTYLYENLDKLPEYLTRGLKEYG